MSRLIATFKDKKGEEFCLHSDGLGFKLPIYSIPVYDKVAVDVKMRLYAYDDKSGIFLEGATESSRITITETMELEEKKTADDLFRTIIEENKYIEESPVLQDATTKIVTKIEQKLIKEHGVFPLNTSIDGGIALFRNKQGEYIASSESVIFGIDKTSDIQFNQCVGSITVDDVKDVLFFYNKDDAYVRISGFRELECSSDAENDMLLSYKGTDGILKNGEEKVKLPKELFSSYPSVEGLIDARSAFLNHSKKEEAAVDFGDLDF